MNIRPYGLSGPASGRLGPPAGHFYTLASCNPNGCAAPHAMRKQLAGLIDRGLSDREVFKALCKEHGSDLLRPHLLP